MGKLTKFNQMRDLALRSASDARRLAMKLAEEKQNKLTGTMGQVVGFNAKGEPEAQSTHSLTGPAGADGKSAYQHAVDGGYKGTEAEFQALLNSIPNKADRTLSNLTDPKIARENLNAAGGFIRSIAAGEDLDDLFTDGAYYVTGANAPSVLHLPVIAACHIYVRRADANNDVIRTIQIVTKTSVKESELNDAIFYRKHSDSGWGNWKSIVPTMYTSKLNLLNNWYFPDPVNQKSQKEYTATGYTIDQWYSRTAVTATLQDNGLRIRSNTNPQAFNQRLENFEQLLGQTVTVSMLIAENRSTTNIEHFGLTYADAVGLNSNTFLSKTIPVGFIGLVTMTGVVPATPSHSGMNFALFFNNGTKNIDITVAAVKLELGSQQTLAHQDADGNWVLNDLPNKTLELAKCQRYQIDLVPQFPEQYGIIGIGKAINETTVSVFIPLPVSIRTQPTVVYRGKFVLRDTEAAMNSPVISNINDVNAMSHAVRLQAISDGLVPGKEYTMWYVPSEDTNSFLLDANL